MVGPEHPLTSLQDVEQHRSRLWLTPQGRKRDRQLVLAIERGWVLAPEHSPPGGQDPALSAEVFIGLLCRETCRPWP
jgi:hypothetical protein